VPASPRSAALALATALAALACRALPGAPPTLAPQPGFANGSVFHDRDGDGRRGAQEPGLAGVAVSNGRDVARTDADGRWRLPVSDDTILFVVKPSGWRTPLSADGLPRFHYWHRPDGSPPGLRFPGVAATGELPASLDFPLLPQRERDDLRVIVLGDTQPKDLEQLDFLARDVIAELIGSDADFGVTLGDLVHDDLSLFEPLARAIGRIGVPWHHVIGNHDANADAADDAGSDESFTRVFGPPTYAFAWGKAHFLVLDDVIWTGGAGDGGRLYHGGFAADALAFVRAYLEGVPRDALVVALMHIPFAGPEPFRFEQGRELLALLAGRPHTLSLSAHTHMQYQLFLGPEDGFAGPGEHLHANLGAAAGSWWLGEKDELGIPHATMRCGAPNGWWWLETSGTSARLRFQAARRPAAHQFAIHAPAVVAAAQAGASEVLVNVFAGSGRSRVEMRLGDAGGWQALERVERPDPFYAELLAREAAHSPGPEPALPPAVPSLHLWRGVLPANPPPGTHVLEVRTRDAFGQVFSARRPLRIE
jgi:hypothetical protein